jgi:hypothetical protein
MTAIEPTLVNLLTTLGIASTPDGEAAIKAFNAAQAALMQWEPGTTSTTVIDVLNAFTSVFNTLPIPVEAKALEDIISAGIVTVIGVVVANSPAPTAPAAVEAAHPVATPEESQALHVVHTVADATAKVTELVPGFKRSIWSSPAHQYKGAWNHAVKAAGTKYAHLHQ